MREMESTNPLKTFGIEFLCNAKYNTSRLRHSSYTNGNIKVFDGTVPIAFIKKVRNKKK